VDISLWGHEGRRASLINNCAPSVAWLGQEIGGGPIRIALNLAANIRVGILSDILALPGDVGRRDELLTARMSVRARDGMRRHWTTAAADKASAVMSVSMAFSIWPITRPLSAAQK
jgi:hypothetical protein